MEVVHTNTAPEAIGPYSQGIISGNLVFTAGQIAIFPETGEINGDDITEQTRQVMNNLSEILKAAGSSLSKVVKTTCFLADMNDFSAFNDVYKRFILHKPARSTVAVKQLPKNVLVEVEAIAEIDSNFGEY